MPSQRRHEPVSAVYTAILTILVLGTANASAVRPITSGSSDSRPGDVLPLCYQLNDALYIALAGDLSSLAVLRRHLQLEQFHARRQLELELLDYEQDVTVDEDSGRDGVVDGDSDASSEERAQELARHGEQRRQHAQAAATLTSQLRSKLQQQAAAASQAGASTSGATTKHNSNVKINSTNSGGAATAAQITATAAAAAALLPDLRFLPQCLISRLDPSLFTSPDLPQPQLPTITPLQTAAASHLHHLGHAAQQPHTDTATTGASATSPHSTHAGSGGGASPYPPTETPSRPLVSLMVQYFNRPWMLPVLAAPFRRCSSLHAATTPPNATSFSSDEEAINRTRHLGFGIEMLINVDSRKDAAAVAEFAAGPLGAGGFVVPVYSNNVHEIRSYNRLARLARGKILVMLQDDDVFPEESACMWLSSVVRAFARWPRLGAVGSQRYVFNYHPNTTDWYVHYWDAGAGHVRVRRPPAHLLQQEQEEWQQQEEGGQEEQGQEEEGQEEEGQEEGDEGAGPRRRGGARRRAVRRRQLHAQAQTQHQQGGGGSTVVDTSDQQQQQQQQQRQQSRRLQQQHVDLDGRRWLQQGQGLEAQGREARVREVLEQEARLAAGQPRWRAPGGASWEDVLAASHPVSSSSSSASGAASTAASARLQQRRRWLQRRLHRRSVLQKEEEKEEERKEEEEEEQAGGGGADSAAATAAAEHQQRQELLPPSPQQQDPAAGADPAAEADPDQGPPPYEPPYIPLESYDGRLRLQFVSIIDYAPIAVRRSSFLAVGGIDENMSESGACGVHSDYDLTLRMWMAGWQVAYVEVPGLGKDPAESEGGTHRRGVSGYCWERQWDQAIGYMRTRWGQHNRWDPASYYWFGSNTFEVVAEHVRLLNLQLLQPLAQPPDSYCPFGYGCGLKPVDNITGIPQQVHPPFGELSSWPKHTRVQAPWAPGWAAAQAGARARAAAAGKHGNPGERHGHGQGHGQGQGRGDAGEPQRRSGRFLRRRRRQQGHAAQEVEGDAGVGAGAGANRVGADGGGGVRASRGWRRLAG